MNANTSSRFEDNNTENAVSNSFDFHTPVCLFLLQSLEVMGEKARGIFRGIC